MEWAQGSKQGEGRMAWIGYKVSKHARGNADGWNWVQASMQGEGLVGGDRVQDKQAEGEGLMGWVGYRQAFRGRGADGSNPVQASRHGERSWWVASGTE